jgi:hypothetical protein
MPAMPASLRWAVGLLVAQTFGLTVVVVWLLYEALVAQSESVGSAVGVTVFAVLMDALLGFLAWALWQRRRWARGPAIVLEVLLLPIGYYMLTGGLPWLGVPLLAAGLAGAVALIAPGTREALDIR